MPSADHQSFRRSPAPPVAILGVPLDNVTAAEAIETISRVIAARTPQYVVCADARSLLQARHDAELRRALSEARLVLCGSRSLLWASRMLGNMLPERIHSTTLLKGLLDLAAQRQLQVCLAGPDAEQLARRVGEQFPQSSQIRLLPVELPEAGALSAPQSAPEEIRKLSPDILLVALDSSAAEKWLAAHGRETGAAIGMAIGSRLGNRSPWRSLADGFAFFGALLPQLWQLRRRSSAASREVSAPVQAEVDWRWIKLPERLDLETVNNDVLLLDQLLADGRHCLLEMSAVQFIDSTGIGHLVRLHKRIRATGRQLVILAPSEATQRTLKLVQLHQFFTTAPDLAAARALITQTGERG